MVINYSAIKTLAGQHGLKVSDLVALAPKNDPFYVNPKAYKSRLFGLNGGGNG